MNIREVKRVGRKLRWTTKEAGDALEEFLKIDSPLEKDKLMSICMDAKNPKDRSKDTIEYFINQNANIDKNPDEAVDLICDLLISRDPCFDMIALFNIYDYISINKKIRKSSNKNVNDKKKNKEVIFKIPDSKTRWKLDFLTLRKSFTNWDVQPLYRDRDFETFIVPSIPVYEIKPIVDISIKPEDLKYKFLDMYIKYLEDTDQLRYISSEKTSYVDNLQPLIRRVVERVGYLAFNIEIFRININYLCRLSSFTECKANLDKLDKVIIADAKTKISQTKRKYWLWYVFIEKLMLSGLGVCKACEKTVEIINDYTESGMSRNYYYRRDEANEKGLTLDKIINENFLHYELEELLVKAGILEGGSLINFDLNRKADS